LAFDVKVLQDAKDLAEQEGVKIFTANIIYHLFDHFTAYIAQIKFNFLKNYNLNLSLGKKRNKMKVNLLFSLAS